MSYVEKIISDIIQTTSDLFFALCNTLKNRPLQELSSLCQKYDNQNVMENASDGILPCVEQRLYRL